MKNPFTIYKGLPKNLYVLFAANVINKMGSFVLPLITLILTNKIGFSKTEAGILTTIAILSQAPFMILGGRLVDKFGSRKVIVMFSSAGAFFYLLCGFFRPGIGLALMIVTASDLYSVSYPAFSSIVIEIASPEQLKSSLSLIYLGNNLGLAIGPVLGGFLFQKNLHLLFVIDAVTTFIAVALLLFFIKETGKRQKRAKTARHKEYDTSIFTFLRKKPVLIIFSAVMLVYNFCYIQWSFLLPLQTAELFPTNGVRFYSLLVSLNAIVVICVTPFMTALTHRLESLRATALGGLFYFFSFALFAVNRDTVYFVAAIVVMTLGEVLVSINSNSFVAEHTPESHIGRVNSLLSVVNGAGFALGPIAMGYLLLGVNFPAAWLFTSALMIVAVLTMYLLGRKFKKHDIEL